jgi:hypothetical protein
MEIISRTCRNKNRDYLKEKFNELEANSWNKNIRDVYRGRNECKMGYHHRTNLVKDENGDVPADSHNVLNRWKNYLSAIECVWPY